MSDTALRTLHRSAEVAHDASSWLRVFHGRARLADWDGAAQALLMATPAIDTAEHLDPLTPDLDEFATEVRALEAVPMDLRWTPEGAGIYGLTNRGRTGQVGLQLELLEIDVASGTAREILASEPEHRLCFDAVYPAMHPSGGYLAFGSMDQRRHHVISTADRATGEVIARVGRIRRCDLEDMALSGAGLLTCRGARTARSFQLTPAGEHVGSRALLTLPLGGSALSPDGAALARHERRRFRYAVHNDVQCRDAGQVAPRAVIPARGHEVVAAVGRRVVLVDNRRVRLHGARGELLAEAPPPRDMFLWNPVPSPSGWLVAFPSTTHPDAAGRLDLLDLRTGRCRTFPTPHAPPVQVRWSPSGRKLLAGDAGRERWRGFDPPATPRACTLLIAP